MSLSISSGIGSSRLPRRPSTCGRLFDITDRRSILEPGLFSSRSIIVLRLAFSMRLLISPRFGSGDDFMAYNAFALVNEKEKQNDVNVK